MLVEYVGILIRMENDMSGCEEVELAGVARVGEEESASSLDGWGDFGADRETEGSGERLSVLGGGVGGEGWLIRLVTGVAEDHRLANFDVDVVHLVSGKDALAMNSDLDAILGREGARDNSDPYDSGTGNLVIVTYTYWVYTRPLHPLGIQIFEYGGTNRGLPDVSERVRAQRIKLLGDKVCFGARRLDPDVGAGTSDQTGARG